MRKILLADDGEPSLGDEGGENPIVVCQDLSVDDFLPDFRHFDAGAERKHSNRFADRAEDDTLAVPDDQSAIPQIGEGWPEVHGCISWEDCRGWERESKRKSPGFLLPGDFAERCR